MPGADLEYRVPKERVEATIRVEGSRAPEAVTLHLSAQAEQHYGRERPSDLLNASDPFLPVLGEGDAVRFLSRAAILVATVPAESEADSREGLDGAPPAGAPAARSERVCVQFDDGSRASGEIRWVPPPGAERLLDYLNAVERFFPLREGDRVHLVNSRRVVWAAPLERGDGRVLRLPLAR